MIRRAEAADLPRVVGLLAQLGYELDGATARAAFEAVLGDPAHALLVADEGDGAVGFLNANFRLHLHHGRTVAWIDELVVDERRRGGGIGARLVAAALAEAEARGADALELTTNLARGSALAFYERNGFRRTSHKLVRTLRDGAPE